MPQDILNFTDFAPLDGRFIAISIETKKPSENFEAAQLQLGVWDRALAIFVAPGLSPPRRGYAQVPTRYHCARALLVSGGDDDGWRQDDFLA